MFEIHRYFSIASAFAVVVAMFAAGYVYRHYAIGNLVEIAEMHNVVHAKTLSNIAYAKFASYISSAESLDEEAMKTRQEFAEVDRSIRVLTAGLPILKVKIYTVGGLTVYSSDVSQIGEQRLDSSHPEVFLSVSQDGVPQSAIAFKDRFSAFSGEVFDRDVVETYIPMRDEAAQITGVFELYTDVTELKGMIDRAVLSMVVGLSIVFLVLYGVLVLVVMRHAIAPLELASEKAAKIGPRSLDIRLPTDGMPREVRPLIDTVNGALDRLDQALESQRRFTADAAHELITPIAVLTANIDNLDDEQVAATLRQDTSSIADIVTQLLELSELEAAELREDAIADGREVCIEVVSSLAPVAIRQGKEVAYVGSSAPVRIACCNKALGRAVGNLVKNAIAHTPVGTCVEVDLEPEGVIRVTDQGPGVPPADRRHIFRRFWRGKDKSKPGAGLGLAIVQRVAESCSGTVSVDAAPGGGAVFSLHLPRAQAPDHASSN